MNAKLKSVVEQNNWIGEFLEFAGTQLSNTDAGIYCPVSKAWFIDPCPKTWGFTPEGYFWVNFSGSIDTLYIKPSKDGWAWA